MVVLLFEGDSLAFHLGQKFSTYDEDGREITSERTCAVLYMGAWWYGGSKGCHNSNLNGFYLKGSHKSFANGVNWFHWTGHYYSLRFTEMKIKAY